MLAARGGGGNGWGQLLRAGNSAGAAALGVLGAATLAILAGWWGLTAYSAVVAGWLLATTTPHALPLLLLALISAAAAAATPLLAAHGSTARTTLGRAVLFAGGWAVGVLLLLLCAGGLHRPAYPSSQLPLLYPSSSGSEPPAAAGALMAALPTSGRLAELIPALNLTEGQRQEYRNSGVLLAKAVLPSAVLHRLRSVITR